MGAYIQLYVVELADGPRSSVYVGWAPHDPLITSRLLEPAASLAELIERTGEASGLQVHTTSASKLPDHLMPHSFGRYDVTSHERVVAELEPLRVGVGSGYTHERARTAWLRRANH